MICYTLTVVKRSFLILVEDLLEKIGFSITVLFPYLF